jgi:hypothetical protein
VVAHTYNPSYSEVKIRKIKVEANSRRKVHETPISTNKKLGMVVLTCHPSYEAIVNRTFVVQASPGIKMRLCLKNNLSKKGWLHGSN